MIVVLISSSQFVSYYDLGHIPASAVELPGDAEDNYLREAKILHHHLSFLFSFVNALAWWWFMLSIS